MHVCYKSHDSMFYNSHHKTKNKFKNSETRQCQKLRTYIRKKPEKPCGATLSLYR